MPDFNFGFHAAFTMENGHPSFHAGRVNLSNVSTPQSSGRGTPTHLPSACSHDRNNCNCARAGSRANDNSTQSRGDNNHSRHHHHHHHHHQQQHQHQSCHHHHSHNYNHCQAPKAPQQTHLTVNTEKGKESGKGGKTENAEPTKARTPWAMLKDFIPKNLGLTPKPTKDDNSRKLKKQGATSTMPAATIAITHSQAPVYRDSKTETNSRVGPRPVQMEEVLDEEAPSSIVRAVEKAAAAKKTKG